MEPHGPGASIRVETRASSRQAIAGAVRPNQKVTEMKLSRVLVRMASAAVLLTAVACSGSGSGMLPTASTPSGAVIQGTVAAPAGASLGAAAAQQGIHVSVMGTGLSD